MRSEELQGKEIQNYTNTNVKNYKAKEIPL